MSSLLAVFLSFWSWLPDITWVFKKLKEKAAFLWSIMHCLLVNGTWECLIFEFSFFCGIMAFYVSISDAVFLVTSFSIFDHSVWLILSFWWAHYNDFFSILLGQWSLRQRICAGVFLSQSCHKLVVSTSFWSWLMNVSSVLTSLNYTSTLSWVVNASWICWRLMKVLSFWFWTSCFCVFFCVHPLCVFLRYNFFRTVCG